ncbi:hypothetical protein EV1_044938 [Malus domestica]
MYVKCGVLEYAGKVFHGMPQRDMVSWNTMVFGFAGGGKMRFAQSFFYAMPERDVVLWNSLISGYLQNGEYWKSVEVYVKMVSVVKMGFDIDVVTGSALVDMYGKCKQLDSALKAFRELPEKNWVSWSAVIAGSVQNDRFVKGIELFDEMQKAGVGLFQLLWKSDLGFDEITLSGARRACAGIKGHLEELQLQVLVVKCSLRSNKCVANAMLDMYAYGQNENEKETLSFFVSMLRSWMELDEFTFGSVPKVCAEPDNFTYAAVLDTCANLATVGLGRQIHAQIIKHELQSDVYITSTTIVDMYSKCGNMQDSHLMFKKAPKRDAVTWNAMTLLEFLSTCSLRTWSQTMQLLFQSSELVDILGTLKKVYTTSTQCLAPTVYILSWSITHAWWIL